MRRLLVTVALIALAAGTYLLVSGDKEALKDPKLLVKRLTDATKGPFEDTIAELAAMGERAVPALLEERQEALADLPRGHRRPILSQPLQSAPSPAARRAVCGASAALAAAPSKP